MRVVHFGYADDLPGAARASHRLHLALLDRGVDSWMVVANRTSTDDRVIGPVGRALARARLASRADGALTRALTGRRPEQSLAAFGAGLLDEVARLGPDIVQLHWLGGGVVRPPSLRRLSGTPLVWRLADEWALRGAAHYDPGPLGGIAATVERRATARKRAALAALPRLTAVAPTRWLAEQARRSDAFAGRRIEVISTGVDLASWRPGDRAAARRRFGLPPDAPVVLFGATGGTTNPRKGWDLLVAALRRLDGGIRLLSFGGAAMPDDLAGMATDLGPVHDEALLADVYRAADVFVAPSRQENLPNTGIEALACGTAVVGFDIGGMGDLVEHGVSGWLARPFDIDDLADGVRWALHQPRREEARSRAERWFDAGDAARKYEQLYTEVLA